jgi:NAD(P)-dependent dehydrogenase (short-subunit alcohol dehydrogenase family)
MTAPAGTSALIIGASRGLGYALAAEYLARGWQVTATVRGSGRTGLHGVARSSDGCLVVETVDITIPEQVAALRGRLAQEKFDLLFVNPGVTNGPEENDQGRGRKGRTAIRGKGGRQYVDDPGQPVRWQRRCAS